MFFKVQIICERLLKEQAGKLRDDYDQVLRARMAGRFFCSIVKKAFCHSLFFFLEQYDTFVRFTYDQIHNNLQANTMSCKFYLWSNTFL